GGASSVAPQALRAPSSIATARRSGRVMTASVVPPARPHDRAGSRTAILRLRVRAPTVGPSRTWPGDEKAGRREEIRKESEESQTTSPLPAFPSSGLSEERSQRRRSRWVALRPLVRGRDQPRALHVGAGGAA